MTDNQGLRSALEVFHMAKREAAILSKLREAVEVHHRLLTDMANFMVGFATWKQGFYVEGIVRTINDADQKLDTLVLFAVKEVRLITPTPEHFRPEFRYTIDKVIGVTSDYRYGFYFGDPIQIVTSQQGKFSVVHNPLDWFDKLPRVKSNSKNERNMFLSGELRKSFKHDRSNDPKQPKPITY